jgi:quinol monooxygenase YgiN
MSDLTVVAVITAKPGSADIVRDALVALVHPTRDEDGNLAYDLYESDVADTFVTIESWREPADLQAHMASAHIAATFATAGDHLAAAPVIHSLSPIAVAADPSVLD